MGDKSAGDSSGAAKRANKFQLETARRLIEQTDPLRSNIGGTGVIDRSLQFLQGGFDPSASPVFGPAKAQIEQNRLRGRQTILESTPRGGTLPQRLQDVEETTGNQLVDLISGIQQREQQNALALATGTPSIANQVAATGLGGIGQQQALAGARQGQELALLSEFGQSLGGKK